MARSRIRRVPFILNLDDPLDRAIWQVLEDLLARRRASAWLRDAAAQKLGIAGLSAPTRPPLPALVERVDGEEWRARRPARQAGGEAGPLQVGNPENTLEEATENFLNMFG